MVCLAPFERVEIHPNGNVYFCCPSWISYRSIGNVFYDSLADIWISQKAQQFRKEILNNNCKSCNTYCMPYKKKELQDENSFMQKMRNFPKFIVVCYDRTCNLYCKSCREKANYFLLLKIGILTIR